MSIFIDGHWRAGRGDLFASTDPATKAQIWQGCAADQDDVADALAAARRAFWDWSAMPIDARISIVRRYAEILTQRKMALAELIARDAGKLLWDASGEATAMINKIDISIKAYGERTGESESLNGALKSKLSHRPHGVMAVFGPYNFPGHLPNGHIVPALIAGNSVVFKPSEITPAVAEFMVTCLEEAGLPPGVINLVQGGRETGAAILSSEAIDGLLFTGSAKTGAMIARKLADRPHVIQALEMGGNNPLIVTNVADKRAAAIIAVNSAFISSGQRCTCARRLIVPDGPDGDAFVEILLQAVDGIRVGAWSDENECFMGPVISAQAADMVLDAQRRLVALGGRIRRPVSRLDRGKAFLSPGVIDVSNIKERPDEEIFGPLLQLVRVTDFDAAVREANNTRYGLAAGLISDEKADYDYFYPRVRAGIVNWNQQTTGAASSAPFGGIGLSGNHRPSAYYAADYCAYPVATMERVDGKASNIPMPTGVDF